MRNASYRSATPLVQERSATKEVIISPFKLEIQAMEVMVWCFEEQIRVNLMSWWALYLVDLMFWALGPTLPFSCSSLNFETIPFQYDFILWQLIIWWIETLRFWHFDALAYGTLSWQLGSRELITNWVT